MRLIDANALKEDFKHRLEKAKNWKENALNKCDEELVIRADATIDFICEVIMTIDNAPTVPVYQRERLKVECVQEYCIDNDCKGCLNQCTWFKCPICNIKVEKEDNFCRHCGAELLIRHECDTCRYSDLKITEEPCYSCVYSGETDNINLTDRWVSK